MFMGTSYRFWAVSVRPQRLSRPFNAACAWAKYAIRPISPAYHRALVPLLYVAVAIPGLLSSLYAADVHLTLPRLGESDVTRVLAFEPGFASGTLLLRQPAEGRSRWLSRFDQTPRGWVPFGPARGEIEVAREAEIWLELGLAGVKNPSLLYGLDPNSLYRLSIAPDCPSADEALLNRISQLSGLRELDLRHASIPRLDGLDLTALENLECLWLPQPEEKEGAGPARLKEWGRQARFETLEFKKSGTMLLYRLSPI